MEGGVVEEDEVMVDGVEEEAEVTVGGVVAVYAGEVGEGNGFLNTARGKIRMTAIR